MGKLPKGWVEVDFETVIDVISNGINSKQTDIYNEGMYPVSRIETISAETIDFNKVKYISPTDDEIEKYLLRKGDILFSHINSDKHLGKTAIFNESQELLHGVNLLKIRTVIDYNPFFLNYLLKYYRFCGVFIQLAQRAVNQSSINQKKIKLIRIPLPPFPEQQRIVNKLDVLFASLDATRSRLEKIPQLIKNFKQAVLTQAVTGKLTEEWRKGKIEFCNLGLILVDVKYGVSKKSDYNIVGVPILRIPNIKDGEIDITDIKYSLLTSKEYEKVRLIEGDVLIIRSNGSPNIVGSTAVVRKEHCTFSYAGYLVRLRPKKGNSGEFLNYIFQSNFIRSQVLRLARSTSGVNNINSQEIKSLIFPIFQYEEQTAIVRRVDALFAMADAIQEQYEGLKQKVDTLPQAILAKAFRGELVEQNPMDEPAEKLLQRIQAEKEKLSTKTKKKSSRKSITKPNTSIAAEPKVGYGEQK